LRKLADQDEPKEKADRNHNIEPNSSGLRLGSDIRAARMVPIVEVGPIVRKADIRRVVIFRRHLSNFPAHSAIYHLGPQRSASPAMVDVQANVNKISGR